MENFKNENEYAYEEGVLKINDIQEYNLYSFEGMSMNGNSSNIKTQKGCILQTKRLHDISEVDFEMVPYWVIYIKGLEYPVCKEIISHNIDNKLLKVRSIGNANNIIELPINEIQKMFYVVFIACNVTNIQGGTYDIEIRKDVRHF